MEGGEVARVVEVGQEVTQYVMIHDHHETFSPHIGKLSHSHPHMDNPSDIWLPLSGHQHQGRLSLTERLERASQRGHPLSLLCLYVASDFIVTPITIGEGT